MYFAIVFCLFVAGSINLVTAITNFQDGSGTWEAYLADGVTKLSEAGFSDPLPLDVDENSMCNIFWPDCDHSPARILDAACGSPNVYVCQGRCYPDGSLFMYSLKKVRISWL